MVKPLLGALLLAATLGGCAAEVQRASTSFEPPQSGQQQRQLRVRDAVTVTLGTGYSRSISGNWGYAGSTPQGEVYRPVDRVFTIEGANTHEAYLVMNSGKLVGFYLPGEGAFAPLPAPVPLTTE